jgi:hypothetical protein
VSEAPVPTTIAAVVFVDPVIALKVGAAAAVEITPPAVMVIEVPSGFTTPSADAVATGRSPGTIPRNAGALLAVVFAKNWFAVATVAEPVPPLAIESGVLVSERPAKLGLLEAAMLCGVESVI